MRIIDWLKKKIKGSNSSSTSKKIKEANRTSYYGGGVSTKATQTQVKKSAETARTNKQNEQKKEQEKKQEQISSAFKSSAFKSSVEKTKQIAQTKGAVEAQKPDPFNKKNAFKPTGLPQTTQQRLQAKMQSDINKKLNTSQSTSETKATPPTIKHRSTAMGTLGIEDTKSRIAKRNVENIQQKERSRAADKLKPLIDEKYSTRKSGAPAYAKQGNYAADPDVAKYNVLKHPYATSGTRGALSGTTFGLSELAINKLSKGEAKEAEKFYQANKSKGAETLGELAGGLLSYGGTAKGFENLGERAVARTAETRLGKKLGAEALARTMAGKGAKAALARSLVGDAIQDSTVGLVDTMSDVATRDDLKTPKDYLKAIAKGQAANYGMGLAGNVVANGAAREALGELVGNGKRARVEPPRVTPKVGESIDDIVKRYPDIEDKYLDYDGTTAAVNRYYDPDATAEAAVDRYHDLDIQRAKQKAEPMAEVPKTRTLKDRIADADDFDEFVKANTKDAEAKEYVKANKMSGLKKLWHEQRIAKHKQGIRKISIEEANATTRRAIPENVLDGWFRSGNSGYKPRLADAIAKDPDVINAGMNVAYHNYVNANPESHLPFDEWLNTPQKMYRGTHGQNTIDEDIFSAYTPDRKVAEKHAGKSGDARIEEIEVKPIDTLGSYQTTVEQEFLVPKSVVEANAPKTEVAAEPPKTTSKRKKTPPTREERLANSNGIDQYNARAEHQAERFQQGYEKADNVRAALAGEQPKAQPKAELPTTQAAKQEPKNINLDDSVGKKRVKKTFREQFHELASSAKTKISDSLNAFEEANKQYIKSDHQKWLENVGAIDKTRRYNAIAARSIDDAQVKWNGDVFEGGKSLKAIYDGMDEATEKDFDKYLLMRHAPDRIREGKPIFAGTQYDSVEACEREAKALLDKHPEFAERAEELYQYTRNELQNRVDAGLLKQEVADEWSKKYPNYVPTGRDGDFGGDYDIWDIRGQLKGNTIGAGEIQKAVGGDQPIRSIKEQLADATSRNWRDMSMNNLFRKMFGDKVGDELATYADGGLEKVLDNTINLSKTKDGGKYFAEVFENGEMKRVEIEKNFYDAIEDLYKNGRFGNGIDVMTDAASKVAYPFKQLVTSWNPIFMLKNGMRDFPEAIINSRQTKEFLECMPAAMKELQSDGEFYRAFRNSGVSQANFVNLEEALTSGDNWLKRGVNKFATAQEMVETYPRLIEYMATIKKAGYDLKNGIKDVPMNIRDIAAANAADVTVNFGRSGSVGKMLNRGLVPFFNPSVQGWSKFLRNFSEQGSAKAFLSFSVKALALGAGVQAVNNFMLEDNPNYQQISARDKATNIIIPITWGKDVTADNTNLFFKIPKSRFAATLSLPMVNAGNENKMGWAEMINVAKDQVFVVDPSESNILSPLLLAKQNKTWYGSPIVPKALEDLPKSEQYDANTSKIGKALGKATANLPEELQISPKKADYIIDAETGVIGDFVLPALTPSRQGGGNALQKAGHSSFNVLKRAWTIDSVTQNDLSTRFYDKMQKANTASQSAKGGEAEKEEYKRLSGYSKEVAKINKAITALQNGNRKTKQEDIYGLQKVRNQMMQDAIDGKEVPSEYKAMDAVQKYVGTSYAINHFGTSADKRAMKLYGKKKYGTLSAAERRKAINEDKDFYKGVQSIGKLQAKMQKAGIDSNTTLSRAIALASVDASDDLFGAYQAQDQSRTETAHEMKRARTYFNDGGSTDEFVKLEKARKTLGKLPEEQRKDELAKLDAEFSKGNMSYEEYDKREKDINYNADTSYLGLATSFALANSPERGYRVYDIKDSNIRKGMNLAAMGFTSRDVHKMKNDLDTDGNGYPKKQEIIDYINNGNFKDKATLFDALYSYKGKYNPFGAVTNYTRAQAAAEGKKKGVEWITDETDEVNVKEEAASGGGYYRRRWGRWHKWGHGGGGGSSKSQVKTGAFKPSTVHPSEGGSSATPPKTSVNVKSTANAGSSLRRANTKATLPTSTSPRAKGYASSSGGYGGSGSGRATTAHISTNVKRTQSRVSTSPKMNITPLNIKPVKASKATKGYNSNLSAALKDIENTQKKVAPPKARRK